MAAFDHFDFLAPWYERFIRARISPDLLDLLALAPGQRVLDAAGGTGRLAQALTGRSRTVVVTDLAPRMLAEARKKDALLPLQAPAERLPFATGTFDRVLMADAMHHVIDQAAAAAELWRVLKPGGRLVIEEPDITVFAVKLIALGERLAGMRSRFLRAEQILDLFQFSNQFARSHKKDHAFWVIVEK